MPTNFNLQTAYDAAIETIETHELAESTRADYEASWNAFESWCRLENLDALPAAPLTVKQYISHLVGAAYDDERDVMILERRAARASAALNAIRWQHRRTGHHSPTRTDLVKSYFDELRRAEQPDPRRARPLILEMVEELHELADPQVWLEELTLLDLGFFGALHGAELAGLEVEHLSFTDRGLLVFVPRTDVVRADAGDYVAIAARAHHPICPVIQVRDYLDATGITTGWLFPSHRPGMHLTTTDVNNRLRALLDAQGLDPEGISTQSLRSGFAISAAKAGRPLVDVARKMRLRNLAAALRYFEEARPAEAAELVASALGF